LFYRADKFGYEAIKFDTEYGTLATLRRFWGWSSVTVREIRTRETGLAEPPPLPYLILRGGM